MRAAEIIKSALDRRGMKQKDLAELLGRSPQALNRRLTHDVITAAEFFTVLELLGVTISFADKDTRRKYEERQFKAGVLPRAVAMVAGVRYDTDKADALCCVESEGIQMELYKDMRGAYFMAIQTAWENAKPIISPCPADYALRFFEQHAAGGGDPPRALSENEQG